MGEAARGNRPRRHIYQYCEGELGLYHWSRGKLGDLKASIINGTATVDIGPVSHGAGDPTGSCMLRLVSNSDIARLEVVTRAIESVYGQLTDEHRRVMHVQYWHGKDIDGRDLGYGDKVGRLTKKGLAELVNLSDRTYDRRRDEIVAALAYRLGA